MLFFLLVSTFLGWCPHFLGGEGLAKSFFLGATKYFFRMAKMSGDGKTLRDVKNVRWVRQNSWGEGGDGGWEGV